MIVAVVAGQIILRVFIYRWLRVPSLWIIYAISLGIILEIIWFGFYSTAQVINMEDTHLWGVITEIVSGT